MISSLSSMMSGSSRDEDSKETKDDDPTKALDEIGATDAFLDAESEDHSQDAATGLPTTFASTQWLQEHAKEFMDEWTRGGLGRYVDLPMICVLGDTSSGKSSVLSSLIGLELPSASTLTTKCPVLIQLQKPSSASSSHEAKAVIDIQWHLPKPKKSTSTGSGIILESPSKESRQFSNNGNSNNETAAKSPSRSSAYGKDAAPPPPPPPPKWQPRVLTENLEEAVPECIREAQTVILGYRETLVAPDVISISLWSPHHAGRGTEDLTLVDLPGLVHFQHKHDIGLLSQVEEVVLEYVNNPRSILLPVLPAPTNLHNSKVLQWAKQVDPETRRTIPVLTKPDLMDPGSEGDVVELLREAPWSHNSKSQRNQLSPRLRSSNSASSLTTLAAEADLDPTSSSTTPSSSSSASFQHGFYMVMNRGQAQLDAGTTIEQGFALEDEYFATTLPWNAITEPRLGIPALRSKLSRVLCQVIQDSLVHILAELQDRYEDTQEELAEMGTIFHTRLDQRKFYHSLSQQLVSQVSTSLSGKRAGSTLVSSASSTPAATAAIGSLRRKQLQRSGQNRRSPSESNKSGSSSGPSKQHKPAGAARLHAACHEFFREIQDGSLATINKLVDGASVLVSSPGQAEDVRGEIVHVDPTNSYACVDFVDEKDHTTETLFDGVNYVAEQPDFEEDEVWSDGSRVFIGRVGGHFDSLRKIPCSRIRTDFSWLEEKMAQFRTDDLACFVNVDMFQQVVAEFVQDDWAPPCGKLMDSLEGILVETLDQALKENLASTTRFPLLRTMVESTCHRVAKEMLDNARSQVKEHLQLEEEHPYTQDEVLMNAMNQARFQALRNDLDMQLRLDQEGVVYDTQAIQTILDRVFAKHQKHNWMAEQMELVLSCYGKVATQRVLDRTPQICWQACRSLAKTLQEELGCVTDDVLETCLWESPESRRKFQSLTNQLNDLQKAMDVVKTMR